MTGMEGRTVRSLLRESERYLTARGVPNARRNAEWTLAHVLSCRSTELYLNPDRRPTPSQTTLFDSLVERRGRREPLQYVLGSTEFMGLPFRMAAGVFIPRPETETLVEHAEQKLRSRRGEARLLDLCCGSGVIAVSVLSRLPGTRAVAVDASEEAVRLTVANAAFNEVGRRIHCVAADAMDFLKGPGSPFDAVLSNPPYVPSAEISNLPPEVREYEPRPGLDGGTDGLDFYRGAIPWLARWLSAGGLAAFEIGADQASAVAALFAEASFRDVEIHKDYAGHDRVIMAAKP